MKGSKLLLALWLGANAWAQTLPPKQQVTPPVAAQPNASRTAPAPKPSANSATRQYRANSAGKSNRSYARKADHQPSSKTTAAARGAANKGRRDPFVSPIVDRIRSSAACTGSGRQCLVVGEISLHGVVHSPSGYIAVVMNGEHTYFLRENDPLADGSVERITRDAIILRERSSDEMGRPFTREVTRKLGAPPI